jgi:hypothetical protein
MSSKVIDTNGNAIKEAIMKSIGKNKLLVSIALTTLASGYNTGLAATADEFRTPEFEPPTTEVAGFLLH